MQRAAVNSHCLEHIMVLSERRDIVATEDIVDDRGIKLWAKGYKVSRSLQEKLACHRLTRPLEMTLTVDGGIVADHVVTSCLEDIDGNELLKQIAGCAAARSILAGFRDTPLPGPLKLLLTSAQDAGLATYHHGLLCVSLCAGIAARLRLDDHAAQQLLLAALIHDVGELYVDPEYIHSRIRLAPAEWRQVAVHPRIGQLVIQELTSLPPAIHNAVAEHHERVDGSGYPAQRSGPELGKLGRILAVADTASAILGSKQAGRSQRLAIALRIVPEEFDRAAASAVIEAVKHEAWVEAGCIDADGIDRIDRILARIEDGLQLSAELARAPASRIVSDAAEYVNAALQVLAKALSATGAAEAVRCQEVASDRSIAEEICLVTREAEWRLRNLARNIHLRVQLLHEGRDLPLVMPLIDVLDGTD